MGVFWSTGSDGIKLVGGQTLGRIGFSRAHFGGPNFLEIPLNNNWQSSLFRHFLGNVGFFVGGKGAELENRPFPKAEYAAIRGRGWKQRAPIFPTTPEFVSLLQFAAPVGRFELLGIPIFGFFYIVGKVV